MIKILKRTYYALPPGGVVRKLLVGFHNIFLRIAEFGLNCLWVFCIKAIFARACGWRIGAGSSLHGGARMLAFGGLSIGNCSSVGANSLLDTRRGIVIGDNVSIARDVHIYTLGHDIRDAMFAPKGGSVKIDDYACIFARCTIQPGVNIGKGAVVLPGAVVARDVLPFDIVGGVPAKAVGRRPNELSYEIRNDVWFAS